MSRKAFESLVSKVMSDPVTYRRGMNEDAVRREVRQAARVADRNPVKPAERKPDPDPTSTGVRMRASVDRDSRLSWDLDREHGTAAPRAGFSQKAGKVTRDPVMEAARELLTRGNK